MSREIGIPQQSPRPVDAGPPRTLRWARIALIVGALLLGMAVTLMVWDAATDDFPPAVITGRNEHPARHRREERAGVDQGL